MKMMRGGLVLRGCMALRAQSVAGRARPLAVRLVTVRARDAGVRHPALQKRAVRVHLVALLAVRIVEAGRDQLGNVVILEHGPGGVTFSDLRAARVALRADSDFDARRAWRAACRQESARVERPPDATPLDQVDRESVVART